MVRRSCLAGIALATALALPGCLIEDGEADSERIGSDSHAIVDGEVTTDLPSTGMLVLGGQPDVGITICSLTLVDCNKAVSAAHCVCEGFGATCQGTVPPRPLYAYFQHAGFIRVQSVEVHPDFSESGEHDAAVLTLARPVTGIKPTPLTSLPVEPGSEALIAGFGRPGGTDFVYGIKRRGHVVTTSCSPAQGEGKLCWRFDGSDESSESNVCHGDSGGATLIERDGRLEVVGIHSSTTGLTCLEVPDTESADTSVFRHRAFLVPRVWHPTPLACGDIPQVGDPGAVVTAETGRLELGESVDYTIDVPPGSAELRVAMNSSDGGGANFNVYLMGGATAGPGRFDCKAAGTSPHGYCEVRSPAPGSWYVHLVADPTSAEVGGDFQLVTTVFSGAPIGRDDRYQMLGDTVLSVGGGGSVLANDVESARPGLIAELDRAPSHGQVRLDRNGHFVYEPRAGYAGTDMFRYRASDGRYSGLARVHLEILPARPEGRLSDDGGCAAGGRRGSAPAVLLLGLLALAWRRCRRGD